MKRYLSFIMLSIGIILGLGAGALWVTIERNIAVENSDPYFFLENRPKSVFEPFDTPIDLTQKGEKISFYYWNAPKPHGYLLNLFPGNRYHETMGMKVVPKDPEGNMSVPAIFKESVKSPFKLKGTLFALNNQMEETWIKTVEITQFRSYAHQLYLFESLGIGSQDFGLYRLEFEVLEALEAENVADFDYFVSIFWYFLK